MEFIRSIADKIVKTGAPQPEKTPDSPVSLPLSPAPSPSHPTPEPIGKCTTLIIDCISETARPERGKALCDAILAATRAHGHTNALQSYDDLLAAHPSLRPLALTQLFLHQYTADDLIALRAKAARVDKAERELFLLEHLLDRAQESARLSSQFSAKWQEDAARSDLCVEILLQRVTHLETLCKNHGLPVGDFDLAAALEQAVRDDDRGIFQRPVSPPPSPIVPRSPSPHSGMESDDSVSNGPTHARADRPRATAPAHAPPPVPLAAPAVAAAAAAAAAVTGLDDDMESVSGENAAPANGTTKRPKQPKSKRTQQQRHRPPQDPNVAAATASAAAAAAQRATPSKSNHSASPAAVAPPAPSPEQQFGWGFQRGKLKKIVQALEAQRREHHRHLRVYIKRTITLPELKPTLAAALRADGRNEAEITLLLDNLTPRGCLQQANGHTLLYLEAKDDGTYKAFLRSKRHLNDDAVFLGPKLGPLQEAYRAELARVIKRTHKDKRVFWRAHRAYECSADGQSPPTEILLPPSDLGQIAGRLC
jgi:hypothetical protein